jgi:hypothetical protein
MITIETTKNALILRRDKDAPEITRKQLVTGLRTAGLKIVDWDDIEPIALCASYDMILDTTSGNLYHFNDYQIMALETALSRWDFVKLPLIEFEEEEEDS